MKELKEYTREEISAIRKRIRAHVHVKAKDCFDYRCVLGRKKGGIIVGGIVLRKNTQVVHTVMHRGLTTERKCLSLDEYQELSSEEKRPDDEAYDKFELYDFSGVIKVGSSSNDKDVRIKTKLLNVGDVIYVVGDVIAISGGDDYFIDPKAILSESELGFYQYIYPEYFRGLRAGTKKLMEQSGRGVDLLFQTDKDILHYFLRNGKRVDVDDYWDLVRMVHDVYCNSPSEKIYQLVKKYYYKWIAAQNGIGTEIDEEEFLNDVFPRI